MTVEYKQQLASELEYLKDELTEVEIELHYKEEEVDRLENYVLELRTKMNEIEQEISALSE